MADQGGRLVLNTRLAMLHSSLTTVLEAIANIEETRAPSPAARASDEALSSLRSQVRETVDQLKKLETLGRTARGYLSDLELASYPEDSTVGSGSAGSARTPLSLGDTSLHRDLSDDVEARLNELAAIEQLAAASQTGQQGRGEAELLAQAWADYAALSARCEEVFREYVDLVRGVVLRDVGLDRDLCHIGDALARQWGSFKGYEWRSVTIPASQERQGISTARLIRMGFPEWSLWCLALTAHEFGHVFAAKHEAMCEFVADVGHCVAEVNTWIADTFATVVMGPAYPWAAICLRLDPDSAADDARVTMMLKTLATREFDEAFVAQREHIADAWSQVRGSDIARNTADTDAVMARIVTLSFTWVKSTFERADWESSMRLVERLEAQELDPEALAASLQQRDLRNILSAAWLARLRLSTRGIAGSQRQIETVAERARLTCIALIDKGESDGAGASAASRGLADPRRSGGRRHATIKPPPTKARER